MKGALLQMRISGRHNILRGTKKVFLPSVLKSPGGEKQLCAFWYKGKKVSV